MMRLPTIVTLFLAAASAVMSAAAADDIREDADALSQSTFLRGAGSDAGIHQSLLRAIEADELGELDSSGLTLVPQSNQNDRELGLCGDDAKVFKVDLETSSDGSGTSWRFFRYDGSAEKWFRVGLGPDGAVAYDGNTRYVQRICVDPATYAFVVRDTNGQQPEYTCSFMGSPVFSNPSDFSGRKVHYFTYNDGDSSSGGSSSSSTASTPPPTPQPSPVPTSQPSPKPTPQPINPQISGRLADCNWNERLFTISLKADQYGKEISWNLKKKGTIMLENSRRYENYETDTVEACISAGSYELTMLDDYGDGILNPGYYKVYIDGVLTFEGGENYRTRTHSFSFGQQDMTERDQQWLDSHNIRREKWHRDYGKSYVPLKWSNGLKESSQIWARKLLSTCGQSLYHDPNNKLYGENLASNSGTGSYANVFSTDKIVGRFVEWEANWQWPRNAHLTQVLWRGSNHVGCAEAAKDLGGGKKCHIQVCRYARAGNCNMKSFNDGSKEWWMDAVMQDESKCGAECPPDGCVLD